MKLLCLSFLLLIWVSVNRQFQCYTGYKILVRQVLKNNQNQNEYRLMNKCLCPNNYYGPQCDYRLQVWCYLNSLKSLGQIDQNNIKNQMNYDVQFQTQCWVRHGKNSVGNIQLRQYLSKHNASNNFGVNNQFRQEYQIIWANTTDIFDQQGELKAVIDNRNKQNSTQLTQQQIEKIIIGNNTELYKKPFNYQDHFLGFGFIRSSIAYQIQIINPEYGPKNIANYSNKDVDILDLDAYINSQNNSAQIEEKKDQIVKNLTDIYKNGDIQSVIKQILSVSKKPSDLPLPMPLPINSSQIQTKILPKIRLSFSINPYSEAFYGNIRIQLQIKEQQLKRSQKIGINSLLWTIPVSVASLGVPQKTSKSLIVTDQDSKSYYKVLVVVFIAMLIYFSSTYGYKRYIIWKNKQYMSNDEHAQRFDQQSLKSSSTTQYKQRNHLDIIESQKTVHYQQKSNHLNQ